MKSLLRQGMNYRALQRFIIGVASALLAGVQCGSTPTLLRGEMQGTLAMVPTNSFSRADPKALAANGRKLFLLNCAHCHARDATGDEGPDLHGVVKSDAKIGALIKNGIKGEMPKFGPKLSEAEVRTLVAYIRSLR